MKVISNFENLVRIGQIKEEAFDQNEFLGLINSAKIRLQDAKLPSLSIESKFDLSYNSAHSLALAALRKLGYRANNRFIVFQLLPNTLGLGSEVWRFLVKCHDVRNLSEYEGYVDIQETLVNELIKIADILLTKLQYE